MYPSLILREDRPTPILVGVANYHSLQTKYQRRFSNGLTALVLLYICENSYGRRRSPQRRRCGRIIGLRTYRAGEFRKIWALRRFDIRHAVSFSGTYDFPFGKGRKFMSSSNRAVEFLLGNWSTNWILTLDSGQPQTINCATSTGAGTGCYALYTGVNPYSGPHNVSQFYNPAAFKTPPVVTQVGQTDYSPLGGGNTQVSGPPLRRFDFSLFKIFPINETMRFEFRAESFNLTNTPAFAQPANLNYLDTTNFGRITQTRDAPNDPREIQFALKLYF